MLRLEADGVLTLSAIPKELSGKAVKLTPVHLLTSPRPKTVKILLLEKISGTGKEVSALELVVECDVKVLVKAKQKRSSSSQAL